MRFKNNQRGFTLIELLVVMGIVMLLSIMAVSGYTSYRKSALVSFAVDNLVSQVDALRDKTIHGVFDEVSVDENDQGQLPQCFGIEFKAVNGENEEADDQLEAYIFSEQYVGKKIWNEDLADWEYMGCDLSTRAKELWRIDEEIVILGDEGEIKFVPPSGDMETSFSDQLELNLRYAGSENHSKTLTLP